MFASARYTLLQACPHVLFKDLFDILFLQVLKLRHHRESDVLDLVRDMYEDAKGCAIKHVCLPKIKDDTRVLVVIDEAKFLGDTLTGSYQLMSLSDESPRPYLQSSMCFETSVDISLRSLPVTQARDPFLGLELRLWLEEQLLQL